EGIFQCHSEASHAYKIYELSEMLPSDEMLLANPCTENSREVLMKNPHHHELHVLEKEGKLLAYAIYTPSSMSLREIGSSLEKYLNELFCNMKLSNELLQVQGIEESSVLCKYFLNRG